MQNFLNLWRMINITLEEKRNIFKTLAPSKIEEIQKIQKAFI